MRSPLAEFQAREEARFADTHLRSRALAAQARESLFEGVSMHWMRKWTDGFPAFIAEASGAGFADVAGSSTATSASGTPAR